MAERVAYYVFEVPWEHYHHGERQAQILLQIHELHLLRNVPDIYGVVEAEGAAATFDNGLDAHDGHGSGGWKWSLDGWAEDD